MMNVRHTIVICDIRVENETGENSSGEREETDEDDIVSADISFIWPLSFVTDLLISCQMGLIKYELPLQFHVMAHIYIMLIFQIVRKII